MKTIEKEFTVSSKALMTGVDSSARCKGSNQKGIRFHFDDSEIEACVENVVSTDHCTVLGNGRAKIMLIEHFMAAIAFCDIDALDVYLSHFELPILDGGSQKWVEMFRNSNIIEIDGEKEAPSIDETVFLSEGKTHIAMISDEKLKITYNVNFRHPNLEKKWESFDVENFDDIFSNPRTKEVIEARTFGYLKELESLQKAGFARGVTIENTLGLTEDGFTSSLKSDLEPISHKILDLIGDLRLSGINPLKLKANIIVKEAGHRIHVKFCKILKNKMLGEKNDRNKRIKEL